VPLVAVVEFLDAAEVLDELGEDHLTFSMNLACLERAAEEARPSARAASEVLDARVRDLGRLRDALGAVHAAAVDPRLQRLFVPEAPLADYLRGVYAWAHAVLRALAQLAESLRDLRVQPDWASLRWRIEEAKNFHFDELGGPIQSELMALGIVSRGAPGDDGPATSVESLRQSIQHLFVTARDLEDHLDERFG